MTLHPPKPFFRILQSLVLAAGVVLIMPAALAQSATLTTSNELYTLTNVRSDIVLFSFDIELDVPLVAGRRYENPPIRRMDYSITGELVDGTPSGFEGFELQREIEGNEFYAQGSSLVFEILPSAVLDDGVQIVELAGNNVVLLFDGREIATGRFHPARLELRADGTGLLQNTNNQPDEDAGSTIAAGTEYITQLAFDPGNTTVLRSAESTDNSSSGGGAAMFVITLLPLLLARLRRRWQVHIIFNK